MNPEMATLRCRTDGNVKIIFFNYATHNCVCTRVCTCVFSNFVSNSFCRLFGFLMIFCSGGSGTKWKTQWQPVLSYKHMWRGFISFKGVIINMAIVKCAGSHSGRLFSRRKETRLALRERVD